MSKISIGTGLGHLADLSWLGGGDITPPPVASFALILADGTGDIQVGPVQVSVTVTGSTGFDGSYVADISDLANGPVNLVPPALSGLAETGETLTLQAGLWIYEDAGIEPVLGYQWQRDGADISGQVGSSYVIDPSDDDTTLSLVETATDALGSRSAQTAGMYITPVYPLELTLDGGDVMIDAGPTQLSITITGTPDFDGTYVIDTPDLALGPVNLVRPAVLGLDQVGEELQVRAGLWAYEDNGAEPIFGYQWYRDSTAISAADGLTYTVDVADEGSTLSVIEVAVGTNGNTIAQTDGLAIAPPPPTLSVSRVGGFLSSGNPSNTPAFTVDLSAYDSGTTLIAFYGPSFYATGSTLDGVAGVKISQDGADIGASRVAAFAHTLTAPGAANSVISFEIPVSNNHHVISLHAVQGGVVSEVVMVRNADGAAQSLSVTPTTPNNVILACAMGVSFMDAVFTWNGATEIETANMPTGSSRNISAAQQSNVAVGPHTVTGTPSGSNHTGIIAIALSEG